MSLRIGCLRHGHPITTANPPVSAKAMRTLEAELGGRAPAGLASLTDAQLRAFTDLLHAAKKRQSAALDAAAEQSLEIVPRMLRGSVRKILFS